MTGCSAFGCSNRSEQGYCLKVFPKDPKRRKLWVEKVRRQNWVPTDKSYLCEIHFDVNQWEVVRVDGKKKLKCDAVPTIFNHIPIQGESKLPIERNFLQEKEIELTDEFAEENSIMPNVCSAYGCFNSSDKAICREKNISFHRFPVNDENRLKLWLESTKRKNIFLTTNDRICSEHFYNSDFRYQQFTNRRVLLRSAVPTKFYVSVTEAPASSRTSYQSESSIVQDDVCETEISSKEMSTQTNDISTNHLLTEIEKLKAENSQLKADLKKITEYVIQLLETL